MFSLSQHFGSRFGVKGEMGLVNYVPRKIHVVNRQTPAHSAKSFSTVDFFVKHQRFSEDKEVRYVILEYSNTARSQFNSFDTDGEVIQNLEIAKWLAKV